MKTRIAVAGAAGRMGRGIVRAVRAEDDMKLALALDVKSHGEDAGVLAGLGVLGVSIEPPQGLAKSLGENRVDVLVDFTNPAAAVENAQIAAQRGVDLVIGTTGLDAERLRAIDEAVKEHGVAAVISPNMATGVNLFFKLVRDAALALGSDFDVEIIEAHHRHKKDAPSGTALRAGELVAEALGRDLDADGVFGRKGLVGERKEGEIGVHALRAGDIVGDHTVLFAGDGERIEIIHRAHSRDAFIAGVIRAIGFLKTKSEKGRVYTTWDVLGIK